MYTTLMAQHFVFFFLVQVSLASFLQGKESFLRRWNGNNDEPSATCECDVRDEISKLERLITDIDDIKKELHCVSKCTNAMVFSGSTEEYARWTQPANTNSATDGGLDAITSCFWTKTETATEAPTVLSYAVPTTANEFYIALKSSNLKTILKDRAHYLYENIELNDGKWHHVCVTWKSIDGSAQVYKDGAAFETKKIENVAGERIEQSGIWIVGQDQDSFGGGFELRNAFEGSLTDVNVWDRVLNASEIYTIATKNCGLGMQGNYRAYQDFHPQGPLKMVKTSCCN